MGLEAEVAAAVKKIRKEGNKATKKIEEATKAATEAAAETIRVEAEAAAKMIRPEAEVGLLQDRLTEAEIEALMIAEQAAADEVLRIAEQAAADAVTLEAEASSETPVEPVDTEHSSPDVVKVWEILIPSGDLMKCDETEGKFDENGNGDDNLHCVINMYNGTYDLKGWADTRSVDEIQGSWMRGPAFNGKHMYAG